MQFTSTGYSRSKYAPGGARRRTKSTSKKISKKTSKRRSSSKYRPSEGGLVGKMLGKNQSLIHNHVLSSQLSVYENPFSIATKYPKVPDGKESFTIGLPFQYSKQVRGLPGANSWIFVFYPGVTDTVMVYSSPHIFGDVAPNGNDRNLTTVSNAHMIQHLLPKVSDNHLDYSDTGYSKYRYVSAGLRIGVDSTYLDNGGFWDAIRIPFNEPPGGFLSMNIDYGVDDTFVVQPTPTLLYRCSPWLNWAEEPTYQSGSMKQLGNYEFRLFDNIMEHEFVDIPTNTVEMNAATELTGDVNDVGDPGYLTTKYDFLADNQFDIICVRLFRPSAQGEPFDFSFHTAANIEMVADEDGCFGHFASGTYNGGYALKAKQSRIEKRHRLPGVFNASKYVK